MQRGETEDESGGVTVKLRENGLKTSQQIAPVCPGCDCRMRDGWILEDHLMEQGMLRSRY